ncbi:MAG TPA: DUF3159 domain-containing protein [Actinocrinis sp.]|nr:DUF3159 domain-containing protein [Actinocrinis sp.]
MSEPPKPGAPAEPAPPAESAEQLAARTAAYEASVMAAFGGKRGLAEVGLPSVLFVLVYAVTKRLDASLVAALAAALVLTVVRLAKRDTLQHTLGGLGGVLVCAAVAKFTGQAKDFYLPGLLLNIGEAVLFSVSALVRWPIVGVLLGPVTGEMTAWRVYPARLRAFTLATWLLAAMFLLRVLIEVPLYLSSATTALGVAKVVLGWPLYAAVAYTCWQIIRKAPLPAVAPAADGESQTEAEAEQPAESAQIPSTRTE